MDRLFEDEGRDHRPNWIAITAAAILQAVLLFAIINSTKPKPIEELVTPSIRVEFIETPARLPQEKAPSDISEQLPPEGVAEHNIEPITEELEPSPARVLMPALSLPATGQRSPQERALAETLLNHLCLTSDGETVQEDEACAQKRDTHQSMNIEDLEAIQTSINTQIALELGLGPLPDMNPLNPNRSEAPNATTDFTYKSPVDQIRDPIPGVTDN